VPRGEEEEMKKGRLVVGIVCLALAVVLGVIYFVVPADSPVFYAGEEDLRWVPAVILGIVGVVALATAGLGRRRDAR
jgi:Na+/proline symporter